jgi:hypothetical protein
MYTETLKQENIQKKTWRESVGENAFYEKMRNLRIGPGLWDKVETDSQGNILKIDGLSYEEWNDSYKKSGKNKNYTDI